MSPVRRCSRSACAQPAVATLTYAYRDRAAVLGPLATYAEPHYYDLCVGHAASLTAPLGWDLVRHESDPALAVARSNDDLEALAVAVREAARPRRRPPPGRQDPGVQDAGVQQPAPRDLGPQDSRTQEPASGRRGHLRALPHPG